MTQPTGHPIGARTDRGCLAVADISGYTAYLAGSELDHAQDVLADLTETVLGSLSPPMNLSGLEGDALFVYTLGERIDPSMLLDTLESSYFAFRRRLDAIDRATQCDCKACILIPRLDLKFVAHHGAFGCHRIAGQERLTGSDVILVHRLLKNQIRELLGHAGYMLLTDALVAAMAVEPSALRLREHREPLDDAAVHGWVGDMHERWAEEQERRRVWISPEAAIRTISYELPVEPVVAWSYLTDPALRPSWQPGVQRVDEQNPSGRRGAGTTTHCVHGRDAIVEEVLDWRPFDYFTLDIGVPVPGIRKMRVTIQLEAVPGGTRVTERVGEPAGRVERLATRAMWPMYTRQVRAGVPVLVRQLEERAAGDGETSPPAPGALPASGE